jgi:spoIIIJ-associated protein
MGNGEQGETVTVQDRPIDDADVETTDVAGAASPAEGGSPASPSEPAASELAASEPAADASPSEDAAATPARSSRGSVRDLEEEGEVAADYLEELLDIVDVDGDIDIDVENGRASLAIVAEGGSDRSLRRLVGANGEVLEALQELTRLAVQASTGERSRLMLDIAGHRAQRRKVLTDAATKACEEVKSTGKSLSLDPMSAFERKIVHDVVADAGLNSESEGVDPHRHVVILPASA